MDDLMERIAEKVLQRLEAHPRALCIGDVPDDLPFLPVTQPPYDAVVLCSLSPGQLLAMPDDTVCRALLAGIPVYLREEGLEHRQYGSAKALQAMLCAKVRLLRSLGVQTLGTQHRLLTAEDVKKLQKNGSPLPPGAKLTPLARDIWEGKP